MTVAPIGLHGQVFPTDVGMNRGKPFAKLTAYRIPHGCGDEPLVDDLLLVDLHVFPTDVGMNRKDYRQAILAVSIPHGCGDEPEG